MASLNKDTISTWQDGVTKFQEKDYSGAVSALWSIPDDHQTAKVWYDIMWDGSIIL